MQKICTILLMLVTTFSWKVASAQIDLPVTFDNSAITYTMIDFGGNASSVGADPMNAANMVGVVTKTAGAQVWAGTTIGNPSLVNPIPFASNNRTMTVRVYSPAAGIVVKLKAEVAGQPSQSVETDVLTTMANDWETLTFNFNNPSTGTAAFNASYVYNMVSIFFNFGVSGAGEVYYFDDVQMGTPAGLAQIDLPVTFDDANTDYTVTDFGGNATSVGADPVNAANMVGITTKTAGAQTWAGTTIGNPSFASVIPFTATNRKMTVRVYSPAVGASIKLKVEVAGQSSQSVETDVVTTVANAWETLTFDFNNNSAGTPAFDPNFSYNVASIFFNFGVGGNGEMYYFDDVQMFVPTGPAPIDLPVTFDVPNTDYTMTDFGGNATVVGADPLNAANMVGVTTKTAGAQVWAGTTIGNPNFASVIPFTATNRKMTVRVYSPAAGAIIKLKVEVAGQSSQSVETDVATTVSNAWETLTFDFNNNSSGTPAFDPNFPYNVASIFFNFGTTGAGETYYFDDVQMYVMPLPTLPVTFEDANINYARVDFDGGQTTLMANPNPSGINTSATVMQMIKNAGQVWGGSKMTLATPIDFSVNNVFKMKVYSPRANCPVLFKLEGAGAPPVEKTANTTTANAWEELSWDFNGSLSNVYTDLVFIYDLGVMGDGSNNFTFYQDDIQLVAGNPPLNQIDLPVTFEDPTVNYTVTDFGGNSTVLGADPLNATNTVAITTKGVGAELWAGTTIGTPIGFASVIPFTTTERRMTVAVYSPDAGIPVRLKVEVHGQSGQSVETETLTTVANAWEDIIFDFNNQATGTAAFDPNFPYDMASIFFNFGTTGATAGEKIYYWDNVRFGAIISISQPQANEVSIYPNPTNQSLSVKLPENLTAQTLTYQILDVAGRVVAANVLTQANIQVGHLAAGVYSLQIQSPNGLLTQRFTKL